jgi:NAD-dependent dihydropyrimidine dehydrogenase PreA subunit
MKGSGMFLVHVDRDVCTGCGYCVSICPYRCFELMEDADGTTCSAPTDKADESCVACRSCQTRCLEFAIDIVE